MALIRGEQITGAVALANYALTASHLEGSASYALTASYLDGLAISASYASTASFIEGTVASASYALTASFVANAVADKLLAGSVEASVDETGVIFLIKSGSNTFFELNDTGRTTLTSDANTVFLIRNFAGKAILNVSQSGVIVLATQSVELTNPAPNGGIYFTSNSFFVGLD